VKNRLQILNRLWKKWKNVRSPRGDFFLTHTVVMTWSFVCFVIVHSQRIIQYTFELLRHWLLLRIYSRLIIYIHSMQYDKCFLLHVCSCSDFMDMFKCLINCIINYYYYYYYYIIIMCILCAELCNFWWLYCKSRLLYILLSCRKLKT